MFIILSLVQWQCLNAKQNIQNIQLYLCHQRINITTLPLLCVTRRNQSPSWEFTFQNNCTVSLYLGAYDCLTWLFIQFAVPMIDGICQVIAKIMSFVTAPRVSLHFDTVKHLPVIQLKRAVCYGIMFRRYRHDLYRNSWTDDLVFGKGISSSWSYLILYRTRRMAIVNWTCVSWVAYAPGTIAVNVTWIEREFNACQTPHSMYPSIFNNFWNIVSRIQGAGWAAQLTWSIFA